MARRAKAAPEAAPVIAPVAAATSDPASGINDFKPFDAANEPTPPPDYRPKILIDSGAFTAWLTKKEINLESYCDFLERYAPHIDAYFNLDKIAPNDRELAAEVGFKNYMRMRERGLNPIPVFHQGESMKWFYKMLDAGADYIAVAVSSMAASMMGGPTSVREWYELLWNDLANKHGIPHVKVHALGDTTVASLKTYPWYSVDSSSWAQTSGRGGTGHMVINGIKISLGLRHDAVSQGARDVSTYEGADKEVLQKAIADMGVDWNRLLERRASDHVIRLKMAALYFLQWQNLLAKNPPHYYPHAMTFLTTHENYRERPSIPLEGVRIFLASWMSTHFNLVLEDVRYPYILLTYAYLGGLEDSKMRYGLKLMGAY